MSAVAVASPPHVVPRLAGLSIVLPCFNEDANVAQAIVEARAAALRWADWCEVIVVDDGSTDMTREIASDIAACDPRVRVVVHPENRGYGAAVRSGITASRGAWVLLTDADLQFDLGELGGLVAVTEDHDLIAGYRLDRADPSGRRAAAHAWNALVRHSFGVPLRDVDCAFKLVRGPAARALPLRSEGAMVSTELVTRAVQAGWRIAEVGVHHRPRVAGEPTGGDPRVVLRAFEEHRRLRRELSGEGAPLRRRPSRRRAERRAQPA